MATAYKKSGGCGHCFFMPGSVIAAFTLNRHKSSFVVKRPRHFQAGKNWL
jgi:hypothetical protein